MNTLAGAIAHHVEFNNDHKYFSIAVDDGFAIFVSETCELYMEQAPGGRTAMAIMLESSQIMGLVRRGNNTTSDAQKVSRSLTVQRLPQAESGLLSGVLWDSTKKEAVATISITSPIVRIRLSKLYIAVVFEHGVNLYRHQPRLEKLATYETTSNALGLCCLGVWGLAFPGRTPGQIQLVNLNTLKVDIIPAHTSPLRALALSPDGEVVATASDHGTLVRVFSSRSCTRMGELRRGVGTATIYSLDISPSNSHLAVTSDTSTLHIFDLPEALHHPEPSRSSSVNNKVQSIERSPQPAPVGNKWGSLAKLPFAPRVFKDVYSCASTQFDPGYGEEPGSKQSQLTPTLPTPAKGIVGWLDDETVVLISAGRDARYERFVLTENNQGKNIFRTGWSRFMRPN